MCDMFETSMIECVTLYVCYM